MEYKGKNNLIGKKFGRLLVEDYLGDSYWQCKCDCGNIAKVRTPSLNNGKTRSCGCLVKETKNVVDMLGYEGENLKVLQRAGTDM